MQYFLFGRHHTWQVQAAQIYVTGIEYEDKSQMHTNNGPRHTCQSTQAADIDFTGREVFNFRITSGKHKLYPS